MRCYSILLIKHVIHVHSSLPPQCRVGFSSYSSMHPFLFTGHPPVSSNQYGPIILLRPNAQQTITFSTVSERYRCSWGCASFPHILYKNALSVCSFPTRWKFASLKKRSPRNQDDLRFADWWFAQRHVAQPYFHRSFSCRVCILYGNRWRSWCIMLINELFERSVCWDKRLAHFLGDCSKRCFTVTMWFSVLIDRGRQLRPLMLSISAWKVYPMRLANWFRREMDLFNLGSLLHGMSCCLVHWSWEINLWSCNYDLPGKQKP